MPMPTPIEYVSLFLDDLKGRLGSKVDTNEGSRWDALAGGFAQMFARANLAQAQAFDAHVRERATGKDLDDYCSTHGPIRRLGSNKSHGFVAYHRASAAFGDTELAAGFQVRVPFEGKSYTFEVTTRTPVPAGETDITTRIQAVLDGADSNVGLVTDGVVNVVPADDPLLLPAGVSVSGGTPPETDDELRERQRLYEEGREGATRAAIALGALNVPGCKKVVLALADDSHLGARGVIYVGDRDWNTSDTLIEQVAASLEQYRPLGSLQVLGMQNSDVSIVAELEMQRPITAYDPNALRAAAVRNVLDYFDRRGAPYEYTVQSIGGRLERAHDEVLHANVALPSAGVVNPLSPTALALSGFPAVLTRYRTKASLITLEIKGAT
jgi:uncharacterized phage protein gp47/JayE